MKPTGQDAVKYLEQVAPSRQWESRDGMIFEMHPSEPLLFAHEEELHWMKNGVVGARGFPLWVLPEEQMEMTPEMSTLLTQQWKSDADALAQSTSAEGFVVADSGNVFHNGSQLAVPPVGAVKPKKERKPKTEATPAAPSEPQKADAPVPSDKPKSKTERALELARTNPTMTNTELTAVFEKELGMSNAGARTYVHNARKTLKEQA